MTDRRDDMGQQGNEGMDPRGRQAADDWNRRFGREGYEGSYAAHDDSYQAYRQRHAEELDRDYGDWRREQEHSFHRDFEDFRARRRQVSNQPGEAEMVQSDRNADRLVATEQTEPTGRR